MRTFTPAEILLKECIEKGVTISTAESCTGGNIAHELTLIPGASEVVNGGVVSYSNGVKVNVLGVSAADIDANGAVSIPVVRQMAAGAQRVASSRLAVATSGIAGPGGGSEEKPVGTVCICARLDDKELYETAHFNGSRARIIDSATTRALILAIKLIKRTVIIIRSIQHIHRSEISSCGYAVYVNIVFLMVVNCVTCLERLPGRQYRKCEPLWRQLAFRFRRSLSQGLRVCRMCRREE